MDEFGGSDGPLPKFAVSASRVVIQRLIGQALKFELRKLITKSDDCNQIIRFVREAGAKNGMEVPLPGWRWPGEMVEARRIRPEGGGSAG